MHQTSEGRDAPGGPWRPMNLGGPLLAMGALLLLAILWSLGFEGLDKA